MRGERPYRAPLALVEIDDATIDAYGTWPLPRDAYALLLVALEEAGARAVGVDLLFLGQGDHRRDLALAGVTAESGVAVHSVLLHGDEIATEGLDSLQVAVLPRHTWPLDGLHVGGASGLSTPYPDLLEAAPALGHISLTVDTDGTVRRLPFVLAVERRVVPSLSLRLAAELRGGGLPGIEAAGSDVIIRWNDGTATRLPLDDQGATGIDFPGGPDSLPERHSMLDVLQTFRDGHADSLATAFAGKVVLVGTTALREAAADVGTVPGSPAAPLVHVHAAAVDDLVSDRFVVRPTVPVLLGALLLVAFILGFLSDTLSLPVAAGATAGTVAAIVLLAQGLFAWRGIDVPLTAFLLLSPLVYAVLASYRFVVLERWERWRDQELGLAREIQQRLLPSEPPALDELDVYGLNIPAQEVGGDYFDWIPLGTDHLMVALGDVSGKGIGAALLTSHLHASFHGETRRDSNVQSVIQGMHLSLYKATEISRFATFFLAMIPRQGRELVYSNAGHNPGILVRGGKGEYLMADGPPLSILEGMEYTEQRRPFSPGDALVLYSDGVTEAPVGDDLYGEDRLLALVEKLVAQGETAEGICRAILRDVEAASGELGDWDDITLLVVRRRV